MFKAYDPSCFEMILVLSTKLIIFYMQVFIIKFEISGFEQC